MLAAVNMKDDHVQDGQRAACSNYIMAPRTCCGSSGHLSVMTSWAPPSCSERKPSVPKHPTEAMSLQKSVALRRLKADWEVHPEIQEVHMSYSHHYG